VRCYLAIAGSFVGVAAYIAAMIVLGTVLAH
jgi:hypothetical protein